MKNPHNSQPKFKLMRYRDVRSWHPDTIMNEYGARRTERSDYRLRVCFDFR
jgi:hypothetical protein